MVARLIEGRGQTKRWTYRENLREARVSRAVSAVIPGRWDYVVEYFRGGKLRATETYVTRGEARGAAFWWLRGGRLDSILADVLRDMGWGTFNYLPRAIVEKFIGIARERETADD